MKNPEKNLKKNLKKICAIQINLGRVVDHY